MTIAFYIASAEILTEIRVLGHVLLPLVHLHVVLAHIHPISLTLHTPLCVGGVVCTYHVYIHVYS